MELGEELVVDPRRGTWRTVGTTGAEFTNIPKDAIVFNHRQTEELLNDGHIRSRGHALAEGNAKVWGSSNGVFPTGVVPLQESDPDRFKALTSIALSTVSLNSSLNDVHKSLDSMNAAFTQATAAMTNNTTNNAPVINVNNPTFTCTGVTGEDVLHQIEQQFTGLFVNAYQRSMVTV